MRQKWCLFKENNQYVIRRWSKRPDGKARYERLPIAKYKRIRGNEEALKELIKRLNAPITTREVVDIRHAFISPELLEEYQDYLETQIPTRQNAVCEFAYLRDYVLHFFVTELKLVDPTDWYRVHKTKWAKYLINLELAPTTLRHIILAANRFMGWLHEKRPEEVLPHIFKPISRAKFRELVAHRDMRKDIVKPKAVEDKHWALIEARLPESIEGAALLAYHYGLRRAETLAMRLEDVRNEFLSVERQRVNVAGEVKPLKGRYKRKVPHWAAKPIHAYNWIKKLQALHPHTLTDRWGELMEQLGLSYSFHDLRHTFITKALEKNSGREVQLAAGHKDLRTTMRYAHDHRDMGEQVFDPTAA